MDTFEAYFEALRGKKIAVLGLGVSNRPLVRLLLEFGCDVTGCDKTPREKLDAEVLALERAGCKLCLRSLETVSVVDLKSLLGRKNKSIVETI